MTKTKMKEQTAPKIQHHSNQLRFHLDRRRCRFDGDRDCVISLAVAAIPQQSEKNQQQQHQQQHQHQHQHQHQQ